MTELLKSLGWVMYDWCFCRGVYTEKYSHTEKKGYKLKVMPKKEKFIGIFKGMTIKRGDASQLEAFLNTF